MVDAWYGDKLSRVWTAEREMTLLDNVFGVGNAMLKGIVIVDRKQYWIYKDSRKKLLGRLIDSFTGSSST